MGITYFLITYTYDAVGNITRIADAIHTDTQDFRYDELNRLIYAKGSYGEKNYTYDEIGNILAGVPGTEFRGRVPIR